MKFKNEAEVGGVVKAYLTDLRYDVYSELDAGFGRMDVVAVCGGIVTCVELKNRLSIDVLSQAIRRRRYVHKSVAAFPMPKNKNNKYEVLDAVHRATGIGIWFVEKTSITEYSPPTLVRNAPTQWVLDALREEYKDQPAGVSSGYWTPFKHTRDTLVRYVSRNPGCTMKAALSSIQHHYASDSSAYSSMCIHLRNGVIKEIERRDRGLYIKDVLPNMEGRDGT